MFLSLQVLLCLKLLDRETKIASPVLGEDARRADEGRKFHNRSFLPVLKTKKTFPL